MSWGRGRRQQVGRAPRFLFFTLAALGALSATSCKDKTPKPPIELVSRVAIEVPAPATSDSDTPAPTSRPPIFPDLAPRAPAAVAPTLDAPSAIASSVAAPPDPDLAIIENGRVQAAGCYTRLPPHDVGSGPARRSASLTLTVVPTGRVTRSEIHASGPQGGPPEPELLDCLRRVGDGLTFTSKDSPKDAGLQKGAFPSSSLGGDIRTITIDVQVTST